MWVESKRVCGCGCASEVSCRVGVRGRKGEWVIGVLCGIESGCASSVRYLGRLGLGKNDG